MIIITIIIISSFSGGRLFYSCASLSQIVLTSGLVQIGPGSGIFQQTAVTSITIPSSVTAMGGEFRFVIFIIIIISYIHQYNYYQIEKYILLLL